MLQLSQCFASNQELELVTSSGEGGSILAYTNVNMCGGGTLCWVPVHIGVRGKEQADRSIEAAAS